ncbi:hypothetical protein CPB84DRAFT_1541973 [Gymnopilus junonius]|uniref:Uncharacterized protein n=1 Tax=Gymnopilus junonius TaxID=109634 RepID=A0A9P5NG62_GYMJU|nr:hypothetical protein CPB84DRAFT_1541973 [Gymnopilus junonius]
MVQQIERFLWLSQDTTLNAYDDFDNLKNFLCSSRAVGKVFLTVVTYIGLAIFCVISSTCIATLFATSLFREPRMMLTLGEIIMFLFWMVVGLFRVLRMIGCKIKHFFSKEKKATPKSQPRDSGYVFTTKSWTEQFTVVQTLRPTATMEYEFYISVNPSEQELKLAQQMRPEDYAHLDQYQREQITLHKSYQPMRIFNPANPPQQCCSIGRLSEEDLQEKRCKYCYRGKPPTRDPDTQMTPQILTRSQFYALNRVKLHTYPPYEALRVMTDLYHDLCRFSINGIQTLGSVAAMEDPERFLLPCPELPAIFSDYRYHERYPEMAELYWRFTSYYMFHPPPDPSTLYEPRKPFRKEIKLAPQTVIPEDPPKETHEPPTPDPVTLKPSVNTVPSHSDPTLAPKPYVPTLYPDPVEICCFRGRITEVELEYERCQFCLKGNPNPEPRPPEPEEIPEHFYPKCRYLDISYCDPENHILYPEMAAKYRSYMNHEKKYPPRKPVVTTIQPTTEPEDKEKTPTQRTQPLPPVVSDNMLQYDEN